MKKKLLRLLSMVFVLTMLTGLLAGCGNDGKDEDKENNQNKEKVTVSLLVPKDFEAEMNFALESFKKIHPEITVDVIVASCYGDGIPSELSTLAAGKNLPDVVMGTENFGYILSQGLAYPLDNLYANDPDKANALQAGIDNYTFKGHLYALPYRVQFNGIVVNLDLIQTQNLDEPDYEWTISDFIDLAKKSTDSQHSGINIVEGDDDTHALQTKLMGGMMEAPYQMYGYNMDTHQFDFTSGAWTKAQDYIKELRSVPGLVSDELKEWDKRNQGIADAYDNKFGGSADAFISGKVLFGNHNTWETHWISKGVNFEWDVYPVPTADGVTPRVQTHIDYVMMTTAVTEEKAQAAYELTKFLSYSEEGCLARMKYVEQNAETATIYTPASSDPEVLKAYNDSDAIKDGMKYMLETITEDPDMIFIADVNKLVPNFWNDVNDYLDQVKEQIKNGGDAHALAQDLQNKVNAAAKDTWETFEKKLEKNLTSFYESHPYENK